MTAVAFGFRWCRGVRNRQDHPSLLHRNNMRYADKEIDAHRYSCQSPRSTAKYGALATRKKVQLGWQEAQIFG